MNQFLKSAINPTEAVLVMQTPAHRKENTGRSYRDTPDLILRKRSAHKIPRDAISHPSIWQRRGGGETGAHILPHRRSVATPAAPRWLCPPAPALCCHHWIPLPSNTRMAYPLVSEYLYVL